MTKALAVSDHRIRAKRRLPRFLFDYMDGGAVDEVTLRRNVEALQAIGLRQRVLQDVSDIRLETTLFGRAQRLPVALAPIGLAGMLARRGEVQAARAAESAGVPFCLSTVSGCGLAEVVAGVTAPIWFQLYMIRDREFMRELLAEAAAANCSALVFTVDMPVAGIRYRDSRSGLSGASGPLGQLRRLGQALTRPGWAWDVGVRGRPHSLGNVARAVGAKTALDGFFRWVGANFDPSINWRDLDFIRSEWRGPLILKGILDPDDAREAAATGADGIVVSNHGGRQLDGASATARALPAIAEAVGDRLTVLADGGVRSGLDVVRMLALGAKGVLLGRAWAYALGGGGGAGVARLLAQIEAEMRVAMALTGATSIDRIDRSILV